MVHNKKDILNIVKFLFIFIIKIELVKEIVLSREGLRQTFNIL